MVDTETVCCMCGDVGFRDSLFRCNNCLYRFQHSYCSNFYQEYANTRLEKCDWCRSEGRRISEPRPGGPRPSESRPGGSSKRPTPSENSLRSVGRIKKEERREIIHTIAAADKGKNGGSPSPRAPTRRYKLLKDVM